MKKILKAIIFSRYFIVTAAVVIGLFSAYFWYPENPIEVISEKIIKKETGIEIDLTPESSKKSK